MKALRVVVLATYLVLGTASAQTSTTQSITNGVPSSVYAQMSPNVVPGTTTVAGQVSNIQVGPGGSFSFAFVGNPDIC